MGRPEQRLAAGKGAYTSSRFATRCSQQRIVVFAEPSDGASRLVAGRAVERHGQPVDVGLDRVLRQLDESGNHILPQGGLLPARAAEPVAAV